MNKKNKDTVRIVGFTGSLLLAGMLIFYFINHQSEPAQNELGTCKTPEEAYQETQKALLLLSTNINSGIENVHHNTKENKVVK